MDSAYPRNSLESPIDALSPSGTIKQLSIGILKDLTLASLYSNFCSCIIVEGEAPHYQFLLRIMTSREETGFV